MVWKMIRGIHRWPETEGRVTSVYRYTGRGSKGRPIAMAEISISYRISNGQQMSDRIRVSVLSPLYVARDGERLQIRYDPKRPDRYWGDEIGMPPQYRALSVAALVVLGLLLLDFMK